MSRRWQFVSFSFNACPLKAGEKKKRISTNNFSRQLILLKKNLKVIFRKAAVP
jgi:hypothetical protein